MRPFIGLITWWQCCSSTCNVNDKLLSARCTSLTFESKMENMNALIGRSRPTCCRVVPRFRQLAFAPSNPREKAVRYPLNILWLVWSTCGVCFCYLAVPTAISGSLSLTFSLSLPPSLCSQFFRSVREWEESKNRALWLPSLSRTLPPSFTPTAYPLLLCTAARNTPLIFFPSYLFQKSVEECLRTSGRARGGRSGRALFCSLSAVVGGRCPVRRKAEVRCDVLCHGARSFHWATSSIVPLHFFFDSSHWG